MTETKRAFRALDEAALVALATDLAGRTHDGGVIFLEGELGAGKTTFARALLRARGVGERVKSPTYSLIESYSGSGHPAHHLDLYRIADPGELEWLGLADLVAPGALLLVEWPERGAGALPPPDLTLRLAHAGAGRHLEAIANTPLGAKWLAVWPVCP